MLMFSRLYRNLYPLNLSRVLRQSPADTAFADPEVFAKSKGFDVDEFLDVVLLGIAVPLKMLGRRVNDWISMTKNA